MWAITNIMTVIIMVQMITAPLQLGCMGKKEKDIALVEFDCCLYYRKHIANENRKKHVRSLTPLQIRGTKSKEKKFAPVGFGS